MASPEDLIHALGQGHAVIHFTAVNALVRIGKNAIPHLLTALNHQHPDVRRGAATALGQLSAQDAATPLGDLLGDEDRHVAEAAEFGLVSLGVIALPVLKQALDNPQPSTRLRAISGLGRLKTSAEDVSPRLAALLQEPNPEIVREAVIALGRIGSDSPRVMESMLHLAETTQDRNLQLEIIYSLGQFGTVGTDAVPYLIRQLEGDSRNIHRAALVSLGRIGPTAKPALAVLIDLALQPHNPDRHLAANTAFLIDLAAAKRAGFNSGDSIAVAQADIGSLDVGPGDWPQWGGSRLRNNTPVGENIPTEWDIDTGKNILWTAKLGSVTYGNPVVANGHIYIGTNNGAGYIARYPSNSETQIDLGCLLCFEEKTGQLLWQYSSPKLRSGRVHDWPFQGMPSTPVVDRNRLWAVTNRCEVLCLDTEGFLDWENDGPYRDEDKLDPNEADIIWKFDMMAGLGVSPHNMSQCSIITAEGKLFVCTSNGLDESYIKLTAPDAPSFICLDRITGQVLWTDKSPGNNILLGQWASPSYALLGGRPQVIFPGGDGWLYSFDSKGDGQGKSKLLWKFDCNPKTTKWIVGGRGTRNNLIGFACIYKGSVYIAVGQDPDHGEGDGHLWCIDPTKKFDGSDVSPTLAVDRNGKPIPSRRILAVDPALGEREIPNPDSALVWHYDWHDGDINGNGDGKKDFEEVFHRTLGTPAIKDDVLYIADYSGLFHCVNAQTGVPYWTYDMWASSWGSPLIVEDKVYIGDEEGDIAIFRHSSDPNMALKADLVTGEVPELGEINMGNSVYSTPIVANNVLYIATKNTLYAIGHTDGQPAIAPPAPSRRN